MSRLFLLLAFFTSHVGVAAAKTAKEIFQEQQAQIAREFSKEPSLRVAMEYLIHADIMRMLDSRAMLRPTFVVAVSNEPAFKADSITKRLTAITHLPSATIDLKTFEEFDQTKIVDAFKQKMFRAMLGNSRMHMLIKIPEKPLSPAMTFLFEKIEEMLTARSLSVNEVSMPLRNIDFLFYTTAHNIPADRQNNFGLKTTLEYQRKLPHKFLMRMRQIFVLIPGDCAPEFL